MLPDQGRQVSSFVFQVSGSQAAERWVSPTQFTPMKNAI
jgi:hypothetical protein